MSLFEMGRVVTTCGVAEKMKEDISFSIGVVQALQRHSEGDWGKYPMMTKMSTTRP